MGPQLRKHTYANNSIDLQLIVIRRKNQSFVLIYLLYSHFQQLPPAILLKLRTPLTHLK